MVLNTGSSADLQIADHSLNPARPASVRRPCARDRNLAAPRARSPSRTPLRRIAGSVGRRRREWRNWRDCWPWLEANRLALASQSRYSDIQCRESATQPADEPHFLVRTLAAEFPDGRALAI